jgi:hypothetical protein
LIGNWWCFEEKPGKALACDTRRQTVHTVPLLFLFESQSTFASSFDRKKKEMLLVQVLCGDVGESAL